MQKWLVVVALALTATATAVRAASGAPDVQAIKGPDGETFGVLLQCNSCAAPKPGAKACHNGAEEGFLNGHACGKCMITENFGARLSYPYDLHFTGKLVDAHGEPIKNRFVKVFMANGWNIRTRTSEGGTYRLMLGATAERKGNAPVVVDLGTRADDPKANKDFYALFILPEGYKACPAAKPAPKKGKAKKS